MNYYNEFDHKAAEWLRELIKAGEIPAGDVDERSIVDVKPDDLRKYTQCHFFAGIGGWALALKLAGWPADRPVWTGSCPCQPFSSAGKQVGRADSRHLFPTWRRLINRCGPPTVYGEQVASALGRDWLAGIRSQLEIMGYAVGAADLCAAGISEKDPRFQESARFLEELAQFAADRGHADIAERLHLGAEYIAGLVCGSPHIRQRIYWVAHAITERHAIRHEPTGAADGRSRSRSTLVRCGEPCGLADSDGGQPGNGGLQSSGLDGQQPENGGALRLEHPSGDRREQWRPEPGGRSVAGGCRIGGGVVGLEHTDGDGRRQAGRNTSGGTEAHAGGQADRAGDGIATDGSDSLSLSLSLSGWSTPTSRDHKDGMSEGTVPTNGLLGRQVWAASGPTSTSSLAQTGKRGALNPAHSRWLMGYPAAWDSCGATAMQSCRSARLRSSKRPKEVAS